MRWSCSRVLSISSSKFLYCNYNFLRQPISSGDVDWVAVKANAVARAQIVQGQLVAAVNYVQGQVNQLVK